MRTNHRLSDAEREQRRETDRARLKHATEQLLDSDGWQRWLRGRSRNGLARYSVNNQPPDRSGLSRRELRVRL